VLRVCITCVDEAYRAYLEYRASKEISNLRGVNAGGQFESLSPRQYFSFQSFTRLVSTLVSVN